MEIREQLESILKGIPTSSSLRERIVFYENFYRLYGYDFRDKEGLKKKGSFFLEGRPDVDVSGLSDDEIPF
jgi:hypothetical protein